MPQGDTQSGGVLRQFPTTRWTLIQGARDRTSPAFQQAIEQLSRAYWKPIYAYIRTARSVGSEEAKDLTQDFFLELFEGELLSRFAPDQGSFRRYLKGAIHLFLLQTHRQKEALKRGGNRKFISLNDEDTGFLDRFLTSTSESPDAIFDRQWANSTLDLALAELHEELKSDGKEVHFSLFQRHTVNPPAEGPPSYAELAKEFKLKEDDVDNYLRRCRHLLREKVVAHIKDYVNSEEELREELLLLFGS